MSITLRIISGALGLTILVATVILALHLLALNYDAKVLLAGYMAIGGILVGVILLIYAITGKWQPNLTARNKSR